MIKIFRSRLIFAIISVLIVLSGHVLNNIYILSIGLISVFLLIIISYKFFYPLMLFYLPFAPILKIRPGAISIFTIATIVVLLFYSIKSRFRYDIKILLIVIGILLISLIAKTIMNHPLSLDYFVFMFIILAIPNYFKFVKREVSAEQTIKFFVIGVIIASAASQLLDSLPSMQAYIDVYEWARMDLTRLSGFYGDANYYSAQIIVAINCLLALLLKYSGWRRLIIISNIFVLTYLGSLAVSKSFVILLFCTVTIWMIGYFSLKGRLRDKLILIVTIIIAPILLFSVPIFQKQIEMYQTRFSLSSNTESLTTGRSEIYNKYYRYLKENQYSLILGQGYTNIYYSSFDYRASHNTIIQSIYQFGLFGFAFMVMWFMRFNSLSKRYIYHNNISSKIIIFAMFVACFLPWMGLDMLFFDEFILITSLFFIMRNFIIQHSNYRHKEIGK